MDTFGNPVMDELGAAAGDAADTDEFRLARVFAVAADRGLGVTRRANLVDAMYGEIESPADLLRGNHDVRDEGWRALIKLRSGMFFLEPRTRPVDDFVYAALFWQVELGEGDVELATDIASFLAYYYIYTGHLQWENVIGVCRHLDAHGVVANILVGMLALDAFGNPDRAETLRRLIRSAPRRAPELAPESDDEGEEDWDRDID